MLIIYMLLVIHAFVCNYTLLILETVPEATYETSYRN